MFGSSRSSSNTFSNRRQTAEVEVGSSTRSGVTRCAPSYRTVNGVDVSSTVPTQQCMLSLFQTALGRIQIGCFRLWVVNTRP